MNSIELTLFISQLSAICQEMGATLQKTAFSPNIKDRLDYSCAIFDRDGGLCAQAAHIPVHLGSMAFAMTKIVKDIDWQQDDVLIVNDPFLGGTHLPDVTIISPIFFNEQLIAFAANRAHYADIGSDTPGSMPLATRLEDEGIIISPGLLKRAGDFDNTLLNSILSKTTNPHHVKADLIAQISANQRAQIRLLSWLQSIGITTFENSLKAINQYAFKLAKSGLQQIKNGIYQFEDVMDDDGHGNQSIVIKLSLNVSEHNITVDFTGTAKQVTGNINCPLSVTAAAVYYCFYALMPENTPPCLGSFHSIDIIAPEGCLVNAKAPAAVAAGNVETSSRIVDVLLGALAQAIPEKIPAASQGTMNNVAMGSHDWDYYETLAGGMGAHQNSNGFDAVQTHMTNTSNTPIEILERYYPLRLQQYSIRQDSGGTGLYAGGNGLIREYEFLKPASVSLLTERRQTHPWGIRGGSSGQAGINYLNNKPIHSKLNFHAESGDTLRIETPGGGGFSN